MDLYPCEICMIVCGNYANFEAHVSGKSHRKKMGQLPVVTSVAPPAIAKVTIDWNDWNDYEDDEPRHQPMTPKVVAPATLQPPAKLQIKAPIPVAPTRQPPIIVTPKPSQKIVIPTSAPNRKMATSSAHSVWNHP